MLCKELIYVSKFTYWPGKKLNMLIYFQADFNDRMFLMTSSAVGSRASLYDSLRQSGSASSLIESLQSELKQREGEISQLQVR